MGALDHSSSVKLDGDSSGAVAAYDKATGAANKTTMAVGKLGAAQKKGELDAGSHATSLGKVTTAATQTTGVMGKLSAAQGIFSKGAGVAKIATGALTSGLLGGIKAAGPWGMAIGVAADLLVDYAARARQADADTRAFWKSMRDGIAFAEKTVDEVKKIAFYNDLNAETIKNATRATDDKIKKLEIDIAYTSALGHETHELEKAMSALRVESLLAAASTELYNESLEDSLKRRRALADEARKIEREQEIANAAFEGKSEREGTTRIVVSPRSRGGGGKKKVTQSDEYLAALRESRASGQFFERDDSREFQSALEGRSVMQRGATDPTEAAAKAADAQLRSIEIQRATTGESIELINQEEQARLRLLQVQHDAATTGAERATFVAEIEQTEHDAALARIAQRTAAEQAAMAKRIEWADVTAGLASGAIATTNMAVAAAGVSGKKAEKIAGRLAGVQAMFIGGLEIVKSVAAFASLNIPQGIAHAAAGAFAFVQGGLMMSGSLPTGAGSGGGGSAPSTAAEPSTQASNGPTYNTGPIPGSPSPSAPSAGGGGNHGGGGNTTNVFHISGVIGDKRAVMREIDEGLNQLGHNRRPKRDQ